MREALGAALAEAPPRAALATALLLPVEAAGLLAARASVGASDALPLATALLAGACALEAALLLLAACGLRARPARARTPAVVLVALGVVDALTSGPPALDVALALATTLAALLVAHALLPAGRAPRLRTAAWLVVPLLLLVAPRGRDAFAAQRLAERARGPYATFHEALHELVLRRRARLVADLDPHALAPPLDASLLERQLARVDALARDEAGRPARRESEDTGATPPVADVLAVARELADEARAASGDERARASARLGLALALVDRARADEAFVGPSPDALAPTDASLRAGEPLRVEIAADAGKGGSTSLANTGDTPLVVRRLTVDGRGAPSDAADLVADLALDELAPARRAERLWAWLAARWTHADPVQTGDALHDPVGLLCVWGAGWCDDAATVFVRLARAAGLRARLWALGGHVVPEVFHDGGWHCYDPDGGTLWRADDGRVLSVVELAERPERLERPELAPGLAAPRYGADVLRPIFASTDDDTLVDVWPLPERTLAFTLRPGETIAWRALDAVAADVALGAPPRLGAGTWTYATTRAGDAATLDVPFELPYPALGGAVVVDGEATLEARRPGGSWTTLPCTTRDGTTRARLEAFLLGEVEPVEAFALRLTFGAGAARDAQARVSLAIRHAPDAFAAPEAGVRELLLDASPAGGTAEVTFVHAR